MPLRLIPPPALVAAAALPLSPGLWTLDGPSLTSLLSALPLACAPAGGNTPP